MTKSMSSFFSVEHKWPILSQGIFTHEQKVITPKFYLQSISRRCLLAVHLECPHFQYAEQTQSVLGKTRLLWLPGAPGNRNKTVLPHIALAGFYSPCCEGDGTRTGIIPQGRCSVSKSLSGGERGCSRCGEQELEDKSLCRLFWGQ